MRLNMWQMILLLMKGNLFLDTDFLIILCIKQIAKEYLLTRFFLIGDILAQMLESLVLLQL